MVEEALRSGATVTGRIVAVLTDNRTGQSRVYHGTNLVTTSGLQWLCKKATGESVTGTDYGGTVGRLEFGTAGTTPSATSTRASVTTKVTGSIKTWDVGYPKRADDDARNTASNLDRSITFRVTYTTAESNSSGIDRAIIHAGGDAPGVSDPVLCYSTFTAFTKTSNDTLTFFWVITQSAA